MSNQDPYILSPLAVKGPPTTFRGRLKYLGPGFILSASIVGSGELIATTTLGAQAGFITFWVIIVSCLVKVAVQIEFAKHTILTGESPMAAFNQLPGMKFGKANWTIWLFFFLMLIKILQLGGIVGGVAIILNIAFPQITIGAWAFVTAVAVALMIFRGYYKFIEKFSIWMIGFFTLFTFVSLYFLEYTPYSLSLEQILSGLKFGLPPTAVAVAIGAFGITGVGGDEIIAYNYWCLEKGYAAHAGPAEDSEAWRSRAKGWIKTMEMDAIAAMVVYTLVTAAFYLLGAAVLHAQGNVPQGYEMVETLSAMYTESLGPQARTLFLAGACVVLFSTLFAALAAWTRQFSDIFGQIGWINFYDLSDRKKTIAWLAWAFPLLWAAMFVFIKLPVLMVLIGGVITSVILFIVIFAVVNFRYKRLNKSFIPTLKYDVILWLSMVAIFLVGVYGLVKLF
ncbi:MAG: Nramp family divalent metal transporter [Cyclobacteriaceae bacterium]